MLPSLIDYYHAIEASSARMLEAARCSDWDGVLRLESACALLIAQLRLRAQQQALAPGQRREKSRIMLRILRNDAELRRLTEPALARLEQCLAGRPQWLH